MATLLFVLAGCSSYEPRMKPGQKAASGRPLAEISKDRLNNLNELAQVIGDVKNPQNATNAIPKVTKLYGVWKDLALEEKAAKKSATPEEEKANQQQFNAKITGAEGNVSQVFDAMKGTVRPEPKELIKAFNDGKAAVEAAVAAANVAAGASAEIVATSPEGSTWMMWIVELFVLAACVAFLFNDGIWGNTLRLVNVIFAGLLAINFYEPLANLITNYSADIHSFTAFMDFLSFWICFVGFAAILMAVTDKVSRVRIRFLQIVERVGGIVLSLCVGWVMVGIVLTSLHTAPLGEYPFLGCFQPQASMFFGVLAPDREWMGFTRYESEGPMCRSVSASDLKKVAFTDIGENNLIDKHHKRRIELEKYIRGNADHKILVNKQFIKAAPPPKPGG
jgi:uncharacterized membrane protein required for colicin V production